MNHFHDMPPIEPIRATLAIAATFTSLSPISAVVPQFEPAHEPVQIAARAKIRIAAASPR